MSELSVIFASRELQGSLKLNTAANSLKFRCDAAACLPFKAKPKRINRLRVEGVTSLRCLSIFMATLGLYEEHEAMRGDDHVGSARSKLRTGSDKVSR